MLKRINIITGNRNSGKTSLCKLLIDGLKNKKLSVKGILSPGIYIDNKKVEIIAENINSGEQISLAEFSPGWDTEKPIREWKINQKSTPWGNTVLSNAIPCDVLLVDEVGYLELEENCGWNKIFKILAGRRYNIAFIVIRPSLLPIAKEIWIDTQVFEVDENTDINKLAIEILGQFNNTKQK